MSKAARVSKGGTPMTTSEMQLVPAGTWSVDRVHSTVGFSVEYMAGTFSGTFSDFDVSVADGVLKGTAKVASVQVKIPTSKHTSRPRTSSTPSATPSSRSCRNRSSAPGTS